MQLNNISGTISGLLDRYAKDCKITTEQGQVITAKVMAQHLWRKDKTRFEATPTKIGLNRKNYIIGIFSLDVTGFGRNDMLNLLGKDYFFIKSSPVFLGEEVLYYTAVLREAVKGDENVFE